MTSPHDASAEAERRQPGQAIAEGSRPSIELRDVTKSFGGVLAVSGVSFEIPAGHILGLMGPNGAGKSTIIGMISGFLRPTSGSIDDDGRSIVRLSPSGVARLGIIRTFQRPTPIAGLTALENVLVGMHQAIAGQGIWSHVRALRRGHSGHGHRTEAMELLRVCGLDDKANVPAEQLTYGQLRFLELARCIAAKPRFLAVDEPAAGLNLVETSRLSSILADCRTRGTGILLVDHDVPFMFQLCDEVVVMDQGRVIAQGPPGDIASDPNVASAYLGVYARGEADQA